MNKKLSFISFLLITVFCFGQSQFWNPTSNARVSTINPNKKSIANPKLYSLDFKGLKIALSGAKEKSAKSGKSQIYVDFPTSDQKFEKFRIYESSNFTPELAAKYPNIKSYVGESIDNPGNNVYFSMSPLGLSSMQLNLDKSSTFIEPYNSDLSTYVVYKKSDKADVLNKWECSVKNSGAKQISANKLNARPNADDGLLRTYRLALSCTGEYANYFGSNTTNNDKTNAIAAMNNTMTRVNGVFMTDFTAKMVLIPNNDVLVYLNPSTDPYSDASLMDNWNAELQAKLTAVIGEANYDIGHLFGASGGSGNAGCIGCIGVDGQKGSGITSPGDGIPSGDNFDIDYVAHEMGHQFGGNHTWTFDLNEGTGVQVEPGSGSTIMGYAGITAMDVQPHSDPFFHAISIQQITDNIKSKTISVNTATGNSVPTANAGLDYTIPKSTPFMLTGSATDSNGDTLSYIWEQMNPQTNTTAPNATKTSGVNFRSWTPTATPVRYFPTMSSVLSGSTTTAGQEITVEALPSVARTLNFRFTVRDNRAGGSANNSDDAVITVNSTAGPFTVTSQSTAVTYSSGSTQTVTWNVAGTTANNINAANVDILISTDGGTTWSTLLAATPNDGTENVTIPNTLSTTCRFMVKGTNHIFFNINKANFTIALPDTTPPTAPTLSASTTTSVSTSLLFTGATDNVAVTAYEIYKDGVLLTTVTSSPYSVTGLTPNTTYVFTVKAKDASGNVSPLSNAVSVTTLPPDTEVPTAPTLSAANTTSTSTVLSWSGATDNVGVSAYEIYKDGVLLTTVTSSPFTVTGLTPSTTYSFTVKAKDAAGNVSVLSNAVSVTTLVNLATELYISEYLEGTGNNKAIEISNVTGSAIDLSQYTIKKAMNGSRTWTSVLTLTGNLANNTTYVIAHTSYALNCSGTINTKTTNLDFNGNDVIGLFKGNTLIDIIGTLGSSADFALDTTLRRNVSVPNIVYTTSEWNKVAVNTCTNLGIVNPSTTLSINDVNSENQITITPNPVKGDLMFVKNAKNKTDFAIFDISGKLVSKGQINDETINVRQLSAGVYLIKIGTSVKRFIKQ